MLVLARSSVARARRSVFSLDNDLHGCRQTVEVTGRIHCLMSAILGKENVSGMEICGEDATYIPAAGQLKTVYFIDSIVVE